MQWFTFRVPALLRVIQRMKRERQWQLTRCFIIPLSAISVLDAVLQCGARCYATYILYTREIS
jgi:hypothetical protein